MTTVAQERIQKACDEARGREVGRIVAERRERVEYLFPNEKKVGYCPASIEVFTRDVGLRSDVDFDRHTRFAPPMGWVDQGIGFLPDLEHELGPDERGWSVAGGIHRPFAFEFSPVTGHYGGVRLLDEPKIGHFHSDIFNLWLRVEGYGDYEEAESGFRVSDARLMSVLLTPSESGSIYRRLEYWWFDDGRKYPNTETSFRHEEAVYNMARIYGVPVEEYEDAAA